MDTLAILSILAAVLFFRFRPERIYGTLLLVLAWIAVVALFVYHGFGPGFGEMLK